MKKYLTLGILILLVIMSCDLSKLPHKIISTTVTKTNIVVEGHHKRIDIVWDQGEEKDLSSFNGYNIYRSTSKDGTYTKLNSTPQELNIYTDWIGANDGTAYYYKIMVDTTVYDDYQIYSTVSTATKDMTGDDDALLTSIQKATFRYFWDGGHPTSGLARDRYNGTAFDDKCASGGTGMGLMAIVVGIERGFITREEGAVRTLKILSFLKNNAQRYHGAWAHWINGKSGETIEVFTDDDGGDLIETAFLIEGMLTVRQYFDKTDSTNEIKICNIADELWKDVEWDWYLRAGDGDDYKLSWHWSPVPEGPNGNWKKNMYITGFNEGMITYLLGIAAPDVNNRISIDCYKQGWAHGGGIPYVEVWGTTHYTYKQYLKPATRDDKVGMPLFWTHYSYLGLDPRAIQDGLIDNTDDVSYYDVFKNISLIDNAYCSTAPYPGYSSGVWGLTASDEPSGYGEHYPSDDNGTITPTAAVSSIVYTPTESLKAIKYFYEIYGDRLWDEFGFKDAFNINEDPDWFVDSYLAIDQGPIIIMIENYRTQLLWKLFMSHPDIQNLLTTLDNGEWTITPQDY